ncbi:MAG: GIY-YIG nuclease family protein [Candidatus Omnitrophica bacterium]|nr:GIY-YIG nuclease family protein [Candidatus Omnitrophota bacterium]
MAYVYILQSAKNGRYYIGSTENIATRLYAHNSGGVQATRNLLPVKIVFKQEHLDYTVAHKIEKKLKKLKRRDYIEKIIKEGNIRITDE